MAIILRPQICDVISPYVYSDTYTRAVLEVYCWCRFSLNLGLFCVFLAASQYYMDVADCYRRRSVVFLSRLLWTLKKRPNRSRWLWHVDSCRPMEPCIRWGAHWRHLANTICVQQWCGLVSYFDHFLTFCFCFVRFSVFSTKPRDWLERTSLKWPILCRVGRRTLIQLVTPYYNVHHSCAQWHTHTHASSSYIYKLCVLCI